MTRNKQTTIKVRNAKAKIKQIRALYDTRDEALDKEWAKFWSDLPYEVSSAHLAAIRELQTEVKSLKRVVDYIDEFSAEPDNHAGAVLWKVCLELLKSFSEELTGGDERDLQNLRSQNFQIHIVQKILTDISI